MKALYVHKDDLKVKDITPWTVRGGVRPMRNYYILITDRDIQVGDDMTTEIEEARKSYPDVSGVSDDGEEYTTYGKYSPLGLCKEPYYGV